MLDNPLPCQSPLFPSEGCFAEPLVLREQQRILARVIHGHPNAFGQWIVAAAELHAEVVAHEYRPVKNLVITHQPRHQREPKNNSPYDGRKHDGTPSAIKLKRKPQSREG